MSEQSLIERAYRQYKRTDKDALSIDDWLECITLEEYESIISQGEQA